MGGNEAESRSLRDLPGENPNRDLQMRPLRGARTDESWIHPDELLVREASPDEFDLPAIMEAREHPEGYDLDQRLPDGTRPRDWLTQFNPVRANLPDISDDLVRQYVEENHEARPWLKAARDSPTEVSLVYVAVDRGVGHTLQRHEGFGDEELHRRRVLFKEDPAQLDQTLREAGCDGLDTGKMHYCGGRTTRIHGAQAFATAFAKGIEHPEVRVALDTPGAGTKVPRAVTVPISELLGSNGPHACSGFELGQGDQRLLAAHRDAWWKSRSQGQQPVGDPPRADPIHSFEGGTIEFRFARKPDSSGYQIVSMYPKPLDRGGTPERRSP